MFLKMIKVIKIIYDKRSSFILDIVNKYNLIIETFNADLHTQQRKIRPMQTRYGTKNLPLLIFEDENLKEIDAIWPESNPDWEKEINKKIKNWN